VLDLELASLKTDSSNFSKAELEDKIRDVKNHFKKFLICRKKLVLILGYAFEKSLSRKDDVCEEIKNLLSEEIASNLISTRVIERYCLDGWKKRTKPNRPRENDNLSFSNITANVASLNQAMGQSIAFDDESLNSNGGQPDSPQGNAGKVKQRSFDKNNSTIHSFSECKIKDSRITELSTEVAGKTTLATNLQQEIMSLTAQLKARASLTEDKNKIVTLSYPFPFEDLRLQVQQIFRKTGGTGNVWLNEKLDMKTMKIIEFTLDIAETKT
jgi:hypothetical protein